MRRYPTPERPEHMPVGGRLFERVTDGARTRDLRDHNPAL